MYSLAATVYTACVGKAPFAKRGKKNRREYVAQVLEGRLNPVLVDEGPRAAVVALNEALGEAMSVQANGRTRSAADFGRALQEVQRLLGHGVTDLEIPPAG